MVFGVAACYGGAALLAARPVPGFSGRSMLYEACVSRTTSAEHHTFGFFSGIASVFFFCQSGRHRKHPGAASQ